jgi:hypothetical protein
MTWFAHASQRGSPNRQPGERHTQRSPGPVPSRCGGVTANQFENHVASHSDTARGFPQQLQSSAALPCRAHLQRWVWPMSNLGPGRRRSFPVAAVRVRRGYVSCSQRTRGRYRKRGRLNARLCRALHVCAAVGSGRTAGSNGPAKPLNISRLRSAVLCGQRLMKSPASVRRQTNQCSCSSIRFSRGDA